MPGPTEHDTGPRNDEDPTTCPDLGRRFQEIQAARCAALLNGDTHPTA